MRSHALLDELKWRGLLYQHTEDVGELLSGDPAGGYIGFDPTAPSLHVGNLLVIMLLVQLQRHGHRPVALVGGGTGLIGDPSGKSTERPLADAAEVATNAAKVRAQLERFLDFTGTNAARSIDNAEWLTSLKAVEFMRDVGKHFTVNYMLQKDSVQNRIDAGISYTEFSYMLLQAYDFLELRRRHDVRLQMGGSDQWGNITAGHDVRLQMGGSDQWGNITAGIELIRRSAGLDAHAITAPLVTTAAGTKFGKTESGAVWLDAERTSPYQFYQFFVNVDDRDVGRYVRAFTLLDHEAIELLESATTEHPERRSAQRALADDVTARVHGADAARMAEEISALLFGGADPHALSARAVEALRREIPYFDLALPAGSQLENYTILEAACTGPDALFKSKGDARRMVQQGGLSLNGERMSAERAPVARESLLHGKYVLVRKGARSYGLVGVA